MCNLARLLFIMALCFSAFACSIQVSGIQNAYDSPKRVSSDVAFLKLASADASLISVDGKSLNNSSTTLEPGLHKIVLYTGKNNYLSNVNHMTVLTANFKAGISYYVKVSGTNAWIENAKGHKVSSVISTMVVGKSAKL
jgi:hypothetical protein